MNQVLLKTKELHTTADLSLLPSIFDFVKGSFSSFGVSDKICKQMDIVVEEVFVNIASYAYPPDTAEKPVDVLCGIGEGYLCLEFADKGTPYDPLKKEDPVIGIADKMTIGGYGIFMVKTIADEIEYKYEDEHNILRMVKNI